MSRLCWTQISICWLCLSAGAGAAELPRSPFAPFPIPSATPEVQPSRFHPRHLGPTRDEVIIRNWRRAKASIQRFDADFTMLFYDHSFERVKVGTGQLATDETGRGFIRFVGERKPASHRAGYKSVPESDEFWWWTAENLFKIDEKSRQYELINTALADEHDHKLRAPDRPGPPPVPENVHPVMMPTLADGSLSRMIAQLIFLPFRTSKAAASTSQRGRAEVSWNEYLLAEPIPRVLIVGRPDRELDAQYAVTVLRDSPTQLQLRCSSKRTWAPDVLLDLHPQTCQLRAVKLLDGDCTGDRVFLFKNVQLNQHVSAKHPDFSVPPLDGYQLLFDPSWFLPQTRNKE